MPDPGGMVALDFDFCDHQFVATGEGGRHATFPLRAMAVAQFLAEAKTAIAKVGGNPVIHARPSEIPDAVPFAADQAART